MSESDSVIVEGLLSYTEMEYDYAVEREKPIIRLLHKDPFNQLKGEHIEKTTKGKKSLEKFREKISAGKLVRFWNSPEQILAETLFALQDVQKRYPTIGWVRDDGKANEAAELEILRLRAKVAEYESVGVDLSLPLTNACLKEFSDTCDASPLLSVFLGIQQAFIDTTSVEPHVLYASIIEKGETFDQSQVSDLVDCL